MAARKKPAKSAAPADPFAALYPHVADWVRDAWVEIGHDDCGRAFVRALDIGGMVWEGDDDYPTVHAAMQALDAGIAAWFKEQGG